MSYYDAFDTDEKKIGFCDFARAYRPGNASLNEVFAAWRDSQEPPRVGEIYVDKSNDAIVVVNNVGWGVVQLLPVTADEGIGTFGHSLAGFKSVYRKFYPRAAS